MLFVVCCLLFVVWCALLIACWSLHVVCCLLFVAGRCFRSLFIVCCLLLLVHCVAESVAVVDGAVVCGRLLCVVADVRGCMLLYLVLCATCCVELVVCRRLDVVCR